MSTIPILPYSLTSGAAVKKGLLWQQRDKLFSRQETVINSVYIFTVFPTRWKERFFILASDYFYCFQRGATKVTEMGDFRFKVIEDNHVMTSSYPLTKVKVSDISSIDLLDKRGFLTISINLATVREGRIYLRRAEGLRDWFNVLKVE